jgi:Double zinc ribbon
VSDRYGYCPSCGSKANPGFSFCGHCGRSLVKQLDKATVTKPQTTKPTSTTSSEPLHYRMSNDSGSEDRHYCLSCGAETKPGISNCEKCWRPLTIAAVGACFPVTAPSSRSKAERASDQSRLHSPPVSTPATHIGTDNATAQPLVNAQLKARPKKTVIAAIILVLIVVAAGVIFGVPTVRRHVGFAQRLFGVTHATNTASNNAPASGGSITLTPEQQFAKEATAQITTVSNAVNDGTLTDSEIGGYGDSICNLMPQYLNTYGPGPSAFNQIANEFAEGLTSFHITGTDDGAFVSLAINDICPTYSGDIPAGATG